MGVFKKLYLYLIRCDVDRVVVVMRSIDLIFDINEYGMLLLQDRVQKIFGSTPGN